MTRTVCLTACCVLGAAALPVRLDAAPAFPGAEGFGAQARGGRGGRVLRVTTLEDYDPRIGSPIPGSLRAACSAEGPRTVLFDVAGTIELKAPLRIEQPYITLAGQSAPGGDICLKDHETTIHTHDVIIRHMRFRAGDELCAQATPEQPYQPDALAILAGSRDVIIDHCSASWSIDETLSVSGEGVTNITVQWCIISESLDESCHPKGRHGYGSLIRSNGKVSYHHNLYAHHNSRTPRPGTYGEGSLLLDFRNNVIYNAKRGGYSSSDPARMNYIANVIKSGPDSMWPTAFSIGGPGTRMFSKDNLVLRLQERQRERWTLIKDLENVNRAAEAFKVAPVRTDAPEQVFEKVLGGAGATRPARDAVDRRIVDNARTGTGRVINSQREVGGWPKLTAGSPPPDTDRDGMPDAWERAHGLDPARAEDAHQDRDGDGYENFEEWLNETDPRRAE